MSSYVKITPNGHTVHIPSGRVKKFGVVERPVTYCGLWIHPHSLTVEQDEVPAMLCPVCKRRSEGT